jgi:FkbM family methyltransferase
MKSFRRRIADLLESLSGNLVIPPSEAWQLPERIHLRRFFEHFKVDCVFDVGANAGQYAQMLRTKIGYKHNIVSFEPIPALASELRRRALLDRHWYIEEIALDRESGAGIFHVMNNSQFSSLLKPHDNQLATLQDMNRIAHSIEVQRSTAAAQLKKYEEKLRFEHPFLKLDTQGADLAIIEGAGDLISRFVGIQTEVPIRQLYERGPNFTEVLTRLAELGFEPSAFVPNNEGHFPVLVEIDCILSRRTAKLKAV